MNGVRSAAALLAEEIQKSKEYNDYHHLLEQLRRQPALYEQVQQLRLENFRFQNGPEMMDSGTYKVLEKKYEELLRYRLVREFLGAEARLIRMLQEVNDSVSSAADLDFTFLTTNGQGEKS